MYKVWLLNNHNVPEYGGQFKEMGEAINHAMLYRHDSRYYGFVPVVHGPDGLYDSHGRHLVHE